MQCRHAWTKGMQFESPSKILKMWCVVLPLCAIDFEYTHLGLFCTNWINLFAMWWELNWKWCCWNQCQTWLLAASACEDLKYVWTVAEQWHSKHRFEQQYIKNGVIEKVLFEPWKWSCQHFVGTLPNVLTFGYLIWGYFKDWYILFEFELNESCKGSGWVVKGLINVYYVPRQL